LKERTSRPLQNACDPRVASGDDSNFGADAHSLAVRSQEASEKTFGASEAVAWGDVEVPESGLVSEMQQTLLLLG
jgi:hypothetical protein